MSNTIIKLFANGELDEFNINVKNIKSLNLDDKFSESGNPDDLEKANGFDAKNIAKIFYEKFNLAK